MNKPKEKPLPPAGKMVAMNPKVFRPGTDHEARPINFVLLNGGIGDYINHCAGIQWVQEQNPHVMGRIFASPPFIDVARYLFETPEYPEWKVFDRKEFDTAYEPHSLVAAPEKGKQLINATGTHLLDLGFMYYAQFFPPPPEYNRLPQIRYRKYRSEIWEQLPDGGQYAVFTPGATAPNRAIPAKAFNDLVSFTIAQNVKPVFLGKAVVNETYSAAFDEGYDLTRGVDLREKTSLLEAIQIMEKARFVIGLDNGLLHLAGTTEVPIIFGHNISPVHHRAIRRPKGLTLDIAVKEARLPCIGCQAKMRFIYNQKFSTCVYGDNACISILFEGDLAPWKNAIVRAINSHNKPFWRKEK